MPRSNWLKKASLQARDAYLAYRREGGESHSPPRACRAKSPAFAGDTGSASEGLEQLAAMPAPPA